ncbi:hypothetical protein, partial [Streptomyces albidochromogenes]|uniref:hypothetical protein n=1 Tax=Streptomyces albidochromogenes TaxID=329524 RepID=UPI00110F78FE
MPSRVITRWAGSRMFPDTASAAVPVSTTASSGRNVTRKLRRDRAERDARLMPSRGSSTACLSPTATDASPAGLVSLAVVVLVGTARRHRWKQGLLHGAVDLLGIG